MSRKITLGMGAGGPGRGGSQITIGFGSSIRAVLREVLRISSKLTKVLELESKWKKTYSS